MFNLSFSQIAVGEEQQGTPSVTPLEQASFPRYQRVTSSLSTPFPDNLIVNKAKTTCHGNQTGIFLFLLTNSSSTWRRASVFQVRPFLSKRKSNHVYKLVQFSAKDSRVLVKPLYSNESTKMISALQCHNFSKIFEKGQFPLKETIFPQSTINELLNKMFGLLFQTER